MSEFDFESIKNKAIEQLKAGKPLLARMVHLLPCSKVSLMPHWKVKWMPTLMMKNA